MAIRPTTNLEPAVTSFVGRTQELQNGLAALASYKTVWICGAPGVGKTRLARELAAQGPQADQWFVDAHYVRDEPTLLARIADAVGANVGKDAGAMAWMLNQRGHTLVVLDNVDDVLEAAVEVASAFAKMNVDVICTSRSAPHDQVIGLHGLSLELSADLFRQRAEHFGSEDGFESLLDVLGGIPLALELAARQMDLMSPAALHKRLDTSIDALGGRGLVSAIEESWNRLDPKTRRLLVAASTFVANTFDLDALEATFGSKAHELRELLNRSLVERTTDLPGVRFRVLDAIGLFARNKRPDWVESCTTRYTAYFAELARRCFEAENGVGVAQAVALLDLEQGNLEDASRWAVAGNQGDWAASLALGLSLLHRFKDTRAQAVSALEAVCALDHVSNEDRFDVTFERCQLLINLSRAREVLTIMPQLEAVAKTKVQRAKYLRVHSRAVHHVGRLAEGVELGDLALDAAREAGDVFELASSLGNWAGVAYVIPEHLDLALSRLEEATDLFRRVGAPHAEGIAHYLIVFALDGKLQPTTQRQAVERATTLFRASNDEGLVLECQWLLGMLLSAVSDHRAAIELLEEVYSQALHAGMLSLARAVAESILAASLDQGDLSSASLNLNRQDAILEVEYEEFGVHWVQMQRGRVMAHLGDLEGAVEVLGARLNAPVAHWDPALELWPLGDLVVCLAQLGAHEEAKQHIPRLRALEAEMGSETWRAFTQMTVDVLAGLEQNDVVGVAQTISKAQSLVVYSQSPEIRMLARLVLRGLEDEAPEVVHGPDVLLIASDGARFRPPGEDWVDIASRRRLAAALNALAQAKEPVPPSELVTCLWPDQVLTHESGLNRLRATLSLLRKHGLKKVLVFKDGGYWLEAEVVCI